MLHQDKSRFVIRSLRLELDGHHRKLHTEPIRSLGHQLGRNYESVTQIKNYRQVVLKQKLSKEGAISLARPTRVNSLQNSMVCQGRTLTDKSTEKLPGLAKQTALMKFCNRELPKPKRKTADEAVLVKPLLLGNSVDYRSLAQPVCLGTAYFNK